MAYALYPAATMGTLPLGPDGVNDLGKVAGPILSVDGVITWQERLADEGTNHPEFARFSVVLAKLKGPRLQRARQFFSWCLVEKVVPANPKKLEAEINACIGVLKKRGLA